jgi:hypothetical protein
MVMNDERACWGMNGRMGGLWMGYWCFDDFPLICDSVMINVLDQGTSDFGVGLG